MAMSKRCKYVSLRHLSRVLLVYTIIIPVALFSSSAFGKGLETLQFHGFAAQSFISTSDNRFFGDSKEGSFDFRELGLNASYRPLPDLQFSAQILSRRAGKVDDGDIRLDYALIDYSFLHNKFGNIGLRIGRIKNPLGIYNDTRDVAFTRPSIFLPQSIYFDRTRNLALSADSIYIYGEFQTSSGEIFFELGTGYPTVNDKETELAFLGPQPGNLDDRLSYLGSLIFEQDGGRIRLGVSGAIVNIKFNTVGSTGDIRFTPLIFSGQYNSEFWSLTSEYALRYFKYRNVGGIGDNGNKDQIGESYYIQGTYRFLDNLETFIRYDVLYQDRDDRGGEQFAANGSGSSKTQFAEDWTFGLRWDMTKSLMSRIEYHIIDGTAWLPALDNPDTTTIKQSWNMFALLISYRF